MQALQQRHFATTSSLRGFFIGGVPCGSRRNKKHSPDLLPQHASHKQNVHWKQISEIPTLVETINLKNT